MGDVYRIFGVEKQSSATFQRNGGLQKQERGVKLRTSDAGRKPPPFRARHSPASDKPYGNPAKAQDQQPRRHSESRFSLQTPTIIKVSSLLLYTHNPVISLLESLPPTS